MSLSEQDRAYLQKYNFDSEDPAVTAFRSPVFEITRDNWLRVNGFIEGHPNLRFSPEDMSRETGVGQNFCESVMNNHPLVEISRGWHKYRRYRSIAPLLSASDAETESSTSDTLGAQAREDMQLLIEQRRLLMKHKIIRRF